MAISSYIRDAFSKISAKVNNRGALKTYSDVPDLLPSNTPTRMRPFLENINVHNGGTNGSVTPVEYDLVTADQDGNFDYYIQSITLVISDGTINYSKYGAIAALANGVDLYAETSGVKDYLIKGIKTCGEAVIWATTTTVPSNPSIVSGWDSNNDALIMVFDLNEIITGTAGLSGIRIGRGTKDKLTFVVNDDLTALSDHFILVKGFRLYE
ncbi:MAG: hypothetical protein OEL89_00365 [Candidatus Peregrinibacteria bacterium]|nr:hypothetical protein [Candidatus Peregrinibacteria bacterium]